MPRSTNDTIRSVKDASATGLSPAPPLDLAHQKIDLTSKAGGQPAGPVDPGLEGETFWQPVTEHAFQRMLQHRGFDPESAACINIARQNPRTGIGPKDEAAGTAARRRLFVVLD